MRDVRRWGMAVAAVAWVGLAACGGTVITSDDDEDGGSEGGSAGSGGTGGSSGTGGGTAATGGTAGTGGAAGTGAGAGYGGTGGGSLTDACAPLPDCNWCGGETVYDAVGCPVAYVCANGVDPCSTNPCSEPWDCAPNEVCIDMLCWPEGTDVTCQGGTCGVGVEPDGTETCDCQWSCDDGNTYSFFCESTQVSTSCECMINGQDVFGCGSTGGGAGGGGPQPDPCSAGDCCGFPQ